MKLKFILKSTLIVVFFVSLQSCIVPSKPNIDYFKGDNSANTEAQFTSINLPLFLAKPMIRRALREDNDPDSKAVMELIRKVSKVKILTVENGNEQLVKNYAKYLTDNNYTDWMSIKKDGKNVNIKAQQSGEMIKKLMLTVYSGSDLVFIDIRGRFSPEDISNIINSSSN